MLFTSAIGGNKLWREEKTVFFFPEYVTKSVRRLPQNLYPVPASVFDTDSRGDLSISPAADGSRRGPGLPP